MGKGIEESAGGHELAPNGTPPVAAHFEEMDDTKGSVKAHRRRKPTRKVRSG
jgi:hypothetical protein